MSSKTLNIDGMCGNHCVLTVKEVLSGLEGVNVGEVVKGRAEVTIDETKINYHQIQTAIEEYGYSVVSIQ